MERRNNSPRYLLGVVDEPVTDSNQHLVGWNTSKLGGLPDLLNQDVPSPKCRLCQWDLMLVLQIYAPLDGCPFHRVLYIFGCINRRCWNKSESWIVYRSQKLDVNTEQKQELSSIATQGGVEWLDSADDWGSEDDDTEDQEGNTVSASPQNCSPRHHGAQVRQGPSNWEKDRSEHLPNVIGDSLYQSGMVFHNRTEALDPRNLNNQEVPSILDEQGNTRDIFTEECHGASAVTENLRKLHLEDVGGNGVTEGAVGISRDLDASAEIEPPDEGTITVDTPVLPSIESVSAIFGIANDVLPSPEARHSLKPYFLAVVEEPLLEPNLLSEHERELLGQYLHQEGLNINQLYKISKHSIESSGREEELYEKIAPKHGDQTFYKLLNRLSLCPEQILRYSKDPAASALVITPSRIDDMEPGKCSYCGNSRSFELQILPTAIDVLRIPGFADAAIEFGTVVVFTCAGNCWGYNDSYHEEKAVVHADPDDHLFKMIKSQCDICVDEEL